MSSRNFAPASNGMMMHLSIEQYNSVRPETEAFPLLDGTDNMQTALGMLCRLEEKEKLVPPDCISPAVWKVVCKLSMGITTPRMLGEYKWMKRMYGSVTVPPKRQNELVQDEIILDLYDLLWGLSRGRFEYNRRRDGASDPIFEDPLAYEVLDPAGQILAAAPMFGRSPVERNRILCALDGHLQDSPKLRHITGALRGLADLREDDEYYSIHTGRYARAAVTYFILSYRALGKEGARCGLRILWRMCADDDAPLPPEAKGVEFFLSRFSA